MFDEDKLEKLLIADGFDSKQFLLFYNQLKDNICSRDEIERYKWAIEKGFFPAHVHKYGLTVENKEQFLPTYTYFKMHPLNNFFRLWINDKLTMKYFLSGAGLGSLIPEYYLYIENDGKFTYLVDSPGDISKDESYLWNLTKRKKKIAAKPNNGNSSKGFLRLENIDNSIFINDEEVGKEQFIEKTKDLFNYIFTEYVSQHNELRKIWNQSESVLRCNMYKIPKAYIYAESEWKCASSYLTIGTIDSGSASNETRDAVCVSVDFDTGKLSTRGLYHRLNSNLKWVSKHPNTEMEFVDILLPGWNLVKKDVMRICSALSSLDWIGIDLIIAESGCRVCEVNSLSGIEMPQMICGPMLKDPGVRAFFGSKGLEEIKTDNLYEIIKASYSYS